jgi:hypothetical protein
MRYLPAKLQNPVLSLTEIWEATAKLYCGNKKSPLRSAHACSVESGFIWADLHNILRVQNLDIFGKNSLVSICTDMIGTCSYCLCFKIIFPCSISCFCRCFTAAFPIWWFANFCVSSMKFYIKCSFPGHAFLYSASVFEAVSHHCCQLTRETEWGKIPQTYMHNMLLTSRM